MTGPLSGERLYADICRYESFGAHRYGSQGATAALDWIGEELRRAGCDVGRQPFHVDRQYDLSSATLAIGNRNVPVFPQWWMPPAQASFRLTAGISTIGTASGRFVRLTLPFDRGAYLTDGHRRRLDAAFAREPAAVLLAIDHPSGEIFAYNVDQQTPAWPCPVALVAPKDNVLLDDAEAAAQNVTIDVRGSYRRNVAGHNVVGRLDRGKGRWIVVSTPVTSWFTSSCERGPGIAGFLALARLARTRFQAVNLMFVATSGHEIGHGGMHHFLQDLAPAPEATVAWAHLGATLAAHDMLVRFVSCSTALEPLIGRHFVGIDGTRLVGKEATVGEIRDVSAAGYPAFFGMAGLHRLFHTPADSVAATSADLLEPVVAAFAAALAEVAG